MPTMTSLPSHLAKGKQRELASSSATHSSDEMISQRETQEPSVTALAGDASSPESSPEYTPDPRYHYWQSPWTSDDEDDDDGDDDFDWDAGITDFTLFASDRDQAEQAGEALDHKWSGFVTRQNEALQRSKLRHKPSAESSLRPLDLDDTSLKMPDAVPALTPDASPDLRDHVDDEDDDAPEQHYYQPTPRFAAPSGQASEQKKSSSVSTGYVPVIVEPPPRLYSALEYGDDILDDDDDDDDDPPLEFYVQQHLQHRPQRKVQRPGLYTSRTLSGKRHSWARPSWYIYPVGEESAEEEKEG